MVKIVDVDIYCVHEPRFPYTERKAFILTQLSRLQLMSGCQSITDKLIWITSFSALEFNEENKSVYNLLHTSAKPSEKSCFWKHYDVFQKVAERNKVSIVIEDDAVFDKDFMLSCNALLSKVDNDNFYINLEYASEDVPLYYYRYSLVKVKGTKRTGAYIISPKAARKFRDLINEWIEKNQPFDYPADTFVTEWHEQLGVNTYWSVQALVFQGSKTGRFTSDLSSENFSKIFYVIEYIQKKIMHFGNKLRACFRRKILKRIEYPIK